MYTSGTTGDPKGVLISNKSIVTIVSAVDEFLNNSNEQVDHSYFAPVFSIPMHCLFLLQNLILFYQLHGDDVYISYLPLAHIFDRVIEEVFIRHGASIGFWRGVRIQNTCSILLLATFFISAIWSIRILLQDVKLLVEDIGELKPTVFCAVPRVLDRIYGGILQFD